MDLNDLDDAEKFQKHFVAPMIDGVATRIESKLEPLLARVSALEAGQNGMSQRVQKLESYAKRLGTVYSGIVAVATFVVHYTWAKVRVKIGV